MSSESDQHVIDSGSEVEQNELPCLEKVKSVVKNENSVEGSEGEEDVKSEEKQEASDLEVDSDGEPILSMKDKTVSFDQSQNDLRCKIRQEFEHSRNRQLFLRFPYNFPNFWALQNTVMRLCRHIIRVRRPREERPRYCVVDFANMEYRDKAMEELTSIRFPDGRKLIVQLPREHNEEYINKILEKKSQAEEIYTSTLIVRNIPTESKESQIKKLFPTATDVTVHFAKDSQSTLTATVTLPTPKDATRLRELQYQIGENILEISFAVTKKSQNENKHPLLNGGKRKIEEHSNSESFSPLKKQKNITEIDEKDKPVDFNVKTENDLQKITIYINKQFVEEMNNIKNISKESCKIIKPSKKGNKSLTINDNKPIVQREKKVKKEKREKKVTKKEGKRIKT